MMMGEIVNSKLVTTALIIAVSPSEDEARSYIKKVLNPYLENSQCIEFSRMRFVSLSPVTRTIFLYTEKTGVGESASFFGFCDIGCVYYICCNPANRGEHCKGRNCYHCEHRRCKSNGDGTIDIDNVPCGP